MVALECSATAPAERHIDRQRALACALKVCAPFGPIRAYRLHKVRNDYIHAANKLWSELDLACLPALLTGQS